MTCSPLGPGCDAIRKLHFRSNQNGDADALVKAFHYSGRPPANVQFVGSLHEDGGLFGDFGEIVAACFFSVPPTRWGEPVWELSRLVRRDDLSHPLSSLISKCAAHIAKSGEMDLLVSFADKTQGHHGGIYQASSWNYHGARDRSVDGIILDGVFIPGRSCNSKFGTRSVVELRDRFGNARVEPHYDEGKHLYWKALSRSGKLKAERLGLDAVAYPKPMRKAA
jgi:hypothetical protein